MKVSAGVVSYKSQRPGTQGQKRQSKRIGAHRAENATGLERRHASCWCGPTWFRSRSGPAGAEAFLRLGRNQKSRSGLRNTRRAGRNW